MKINITQRATSFDAGEREAREIILQDDELPYLAHNPGEICESMALDVNNNELVSDTALGCIMTVLIC